MCSSVFVRILSDPPQLSYSSYPISVNYFSNVSCSKLHNYLYIYSLRLIIRIYMANTGGADIGEQTTKHWRLKLFGSILQTVSVESLPRPRVGERFLPIAIFPPQPLSLSEPPTSPP